MPDSFEKEKGITAVPKTKKTLDTVGPSWEVLFVSYVLQGLPDTRYFLDWLVFCCVSVPGTLAPHLLALINLRLFRFSVSGPS